MCERKREQERSRAVHRRLVPTTSFLPPRTPRTATRAAASCLPGTLARASGSSCRILLRRRPCGSPTAARLTSRDTSSTTLGTTPPTTKVRLPLFLCVRARACFSCGCACVGVRTQLLPCFQLEPTCSFCSRACAAFAGWFRRKHAAQRVATARPLRRTSSGS